MKKAKLRTALAAVTVGLMLTGCGESAMATETLTWKNPTPVTIVEPVAIAAATEPAGERFRFGQEVWSVRHSEGDGTAYIVRYAVVAQEGELIAVAPWFTGDAAELREAMTYAAGAPLDGEPYIYLVTEDNCYLDQEEAQAVADEENNHGNS